MSANPQMDLRVQLAAIIGREPPGGFVELRAFLPDGGVRQRFYGLDETDAAIRDALLWAPMANVNFGACVRRSRSGKGDAIERSWLLWADVDSREALERLRAFRPLPQLAIRSGTPGHLHCYWLLRESLSPDQVREANRRLAAHLGADPQATDAARMLRAVGTLNHKTDLPMPVQWARLDLGPSYAPAKVLADVPRLEQVEPRPTLRRIRVGLAGSSGSDALASIPASEFIPLLTGREPGPDWKVQCPFHKGGAERTPSMVAYPDDRGFVCFGSCEPSPGRKHFGGDIYTFAARLYGLDSQRDFPEIRRRLVADLRGQAQAGEVAA